MSLWTRITLLYRQLRGRCIRACASELNCGSITARSAQNIQYLLYMQVNALNYIISASTVPSALRDSVLASPPCSFQQSWFIKLLVGDRGPLIAAKDECVQGKRRGLVQRSTSVQLLNQSWQWSASTDMSCSEENVCPCVCRRSAYRCV